MKIETPPPPTPPPKKKLARTLTIFVEHDVMPHNT